MNGPAGHRHRAVPRDWDAGRYDRLSGPQARWGGDVLGRLPLVGDETVLDAGCGSGRVTKQLLERLPEGRVIALDGSPAMLASAAQGLARFGDRVSFVQADLAAPLPFAAASVDAILSTATFHWIGRHQALFRRLAAVLRPGGRLVAQCGGRGNIASVLRAIRASGEPGPHPWTFADPAATRRRLEAAGFTGVETWLNAEPTPLEPGEPLRGFLRTVILGPYLDRMPPSQHDAFVEAVASKLPRAEIDYVRLNIVATRAR